MNRLQKEQDQSTLTCEQSRLSSTWIGRSVRDTRIGLVLWAKSNDVPPSEGDSGGDEGVEAWVEMELETPSDKGEQW